MELFFPEWQQYASQDVVNWSQSRDRTIKMYSDSERIKPEQTKQKVVSFEKIDWQKISQLGCMWWWSELRKKKRETTNKTICLKSFE